MTGVLLKDCCCDVTQACCLPDGSCVDLPPNECLIQGGTPQGKGTVCADPDIDCELAQACCFENGSCVDLPPAECKALGGAPQGKGTECITNVCGCIECDGANPCDFASLGCPTALVFQLSDVTLERDDGVICFPAAPPPSGNPIVPVVVPGNSCFLSQCAYTFDTGEALLLAPSNCGGTFRIWVFGGPEAQARCHADPDNPGLALWDFAIAVWCFSGPCQMGPVFFGWENRPQVAGCVPLGNMGQNDVAGGNFPKSVATLEVL